MSKSFSASRADQLLTPMEFDIEGEEFSVPRPLPGFVLLDFASLSGADGGEAIKAYAEFFHQVFSDESEYKRFRTACAKHSVPLKADLTSQEVGEDELSLLSIAQWIISEGSGRPTPQRPDSLEQPLSNGTPSDTAA